MLKISLKEEFVNGKSWFDWFFLGLGLFIQVAAIIYGYATGTPDNLVSIISAFAGVLSVILCAQGKISFYFFGYVQLFTYVFGIALPNHLWGEVYENGFYLITMIWGTFVWFKNYGKTQEGSAEIKARKLNLWGWVITMGALVIGTAVLTIVLSKTNDPLPFMDAISTIPAFIAQILMCLGYREQWLHWLIIDVASFIMFIMIGNWMMVAMFAFWCLNCVYGWVKYEKSANYSDWN